MSGPSSITYYPGYSQVQVKQNFVIRPIEAVTNALQMVVTTTENSNYIAGININFVVSSLFGMIELNNITALVTAVSGKDITTNIDSRNFRPFVVPPGLPNAVTPPVVVPAPSVDYVPTVDKNLVETRIIGTVYNNGTPGNPVNRL